MVGGKMKKARAKKFSAEVRARKLMFRSYLLENETTQSAVARELGVSSTAIRRSVERGAFVKGPFAEWWKVNIAPGKNGRNKTVKNQITA